jgi:tRNA threonylcarbamoyladenosine biosynthesis protein TsaB
MTAQPVMLAIETSQRCGSVALRDPRGNIHQEMMRTAARQDDDLLPALDRLMRRAGLQPRDLSNGAVAVSIGPGGFTGLRIAVSTAKMLAETLNVRLLAVPSALVAAEVCDLRDPILVALSAKRESFWSTRLTRRDGHWTISGEPRLLDAATIDLHEIVAVIADEHLPDQARQRFLESKLPILESRFAATACLAVGSRMLEAGLVTDPLRLLPLYPREPEAVTLWNQRQLQKG